MEFTEDFIKEVGLTPEQVDKVAGHVQSHISELETGWSANANKNAEGILEGAAKSVEKLTGIARTQGQKIADYIKTAGEKHFESVRTTLEQKERDLDEKIKTSGASETILKELQETKDKLSVLKQKEATFAEWEENDYKGKFESATKELSEIKIGSAFSSVKPTVPESVNKFEYDYKWASFKENVLSKYNIQIVDGEAIAVNKENEMIKSKLSDLVKKDKDLSELIAGKSGGFKVDKKTSKIDGVPFEVPEGIDSKERVRLIREQIAKENIPVTSPAYAKRFAELNSKILTPKTA